MISWTRRYDIRHGYNAAGEPVTDILDRHKGTASRFLGVYTEDAAVGMLEYLRAECAKRSLHT